MNTWSGDEKLAIIVPFRLHSTAFYISPQECCVSLCTSMQWIVQMGSRAHTFVSPCPFFSLSLEAFMVLHLLVCTCMCPSVLGQDTEPQIAPEGCAIGVCVSVCVNECANGWSPFTTAECDLPYCAHTYICSRGGGQAIDIYTHITPWELSHTAGPWAVMEMDSAMGVTCWPINHILVCQVSHFQLTYPQMNIKSRQYFILHPPINLSRIMSVKTMNVVSLTSIFLKYIIETSHHSCPKSWMINRELNTWIHICVMAYPASIHSPCNFR